MSWGSEGGADVVECLSVDFNELGLGRATKGGRKVELAGRARSWRIRVAHPTPHPNWESRPGTPLVIFLGVG